MDHSGGRPVLALVIFMLVLTGAVAALALAPPHVGALLDPVGGVWGSARAADAPDRETLRLSALDDPVEIVRDSRGVPHIFAESDRDATIALGWVVARDRLFQMEFLKRVATGRLSELVGPPTIGTDRYFRSIGTPRAVRQNVAEHYRQGGRRADVVEWYATGVNTWIDGLASHEIPFEFRLFDAVPERFDASNVYALLAYMAYDLSFRSEDIAYARAEDRLGAAGFEALYPRYSDWEVPIIPDGQCDCKFDAPAAARRSASDHEGGLFADGRSPQSVGSSGGAVDVSRMALTEG
ncbi:MAG: hypothetical protein HKN17_07000, partial [Rhodothermales bacterium]|nr:hypothetical protein [Rhodothermales bacterium]